MLQRTFHQMVGALIMVALSIFFVPKPATAEVPDHIKKCIESRAQSIALMQDYQKGWQQFYQYAAHDLTGRLAFGVYWRGFSPREKKVTSGYFFSYLFDARRTSGSRQIIDITIEPRPLPEHAKAYKDLIHVYVIVTFADKDISRFNLLGTSNCKLVDAAGFGDLWITNQLELGVVERAAQK